jgi:hypothetical protein
MMIQSIAEDRIRGISDSIKAVDSWLAASTAASLHQGFKQYAGKVVLIGPENADEVIPDVTPPLYRYAVHATAIGALISGRLPSELSPVGQFVVFMVLCLTGAATRLLFPTSQKTVNVPVLNFKIELPIVLVGVIVLFVAAAVLTFTSMLILLDPVYSVLALLAGYYATGVLVSKWPLVPGMGLQPAVAGGTGAEVPAGPMKDAPSTAGRSGKGKNKKK